ncbi:JAB-like toxin 1 domain-containing protein [Bacteroides faecalis]|uniref:JAB-like toxin 1 domain-containing protein n=1 Tax=Bacteroides faecalis TaxID=2447885 RepID=UPI0026BCA4A5|nr:JAB-like toxin 1 domain-containing protein [Bacteroides faecalis]
MVRLKNTTYRKGNNLSLNVNRFNEQITGYDKQGNILGLSRYGQTTATAYGLIDNLVLSYNGNQLKAVKDNATIAVYGNGVEFKDGANAETEYTYDENGNLTKDLNKKITTIQYNCLDLPSKIQFESGNSINYLYLADGTKFRTTHETGSNTVTTDYYKNAIYENGVLVKVLTENGYITVNDSKFHYFIQDHQGNNRVVVDKDGKVEEVNHYYPFGGLFANSTNIQPYKYNGKELDRVNGLDWLDYGARQYDPTIGRWHVVDPSGEKYVNWGLYTYCKNNPIIRIDVDGKDDYVLNRNGAIYMMRKTDRIVDVLYASGINGPKATQPEPNWKSIQVFDKSLLKGLEKNKGKYTLDRMLYTTTNSAYDAANVFLFAENNTNVEWTLKGGYMDGKKTFILGTDNNENRVTGIYGLTKVENALFPNFEPIFDIHSHPYTPEAAEADMNISKLLLDVKYSIYFRDDQKIIGYDQENSMTYSIKINSMKDLITYILQQFK